MTSRLQGWGKWEIGITVALVVLGLLLWRFANSKVLLPVLCALILIGLHNLDTLSVHTRRAYVGFLIVVVVVFSGVLLNTIRLNIANPPEWDFQAFWLDGRVGAERVNIYDYQNYVHEVEAAKLEPSSDFQVEKVDIAFSYPPPTVFLMVPLGWFSQQTASVVWYGLHIIFLVLAIFRLWQMFFSGRGYLGVLVVAALVLILDSTQQTFFYAQTGFMLLFFLLSFWHAKNSIPAGIWLALAILIKPIAVVVVLYPILRRQWRVLVSAGVFIAVLCAIFIGVYGLQTFLSYRVSPPLPPLVYTETINQSLLATILRITHYDFSSRSPLTNPVFLGAALVLVAITAWLIYRLPDQARGWAIALAMVLALLVYPATLTHYAVLLLPILLMIWVERSHTGIKTWGSLLFITIVYAIVSYNNGITLIIGFLLCWLLLVAVSVLQIRTLRQPAPQLQPES